MVNIRAAKPEDAPLICALANEIWWPAYSAILSTEQIQYMLNMMYAEEKISKQIVTGEQSFLLLFDNDQAQGFAAYAPRTEDPDIYKLHKLYCLTSGGGYGKRMLDAVEEAVLKAGKKVLELNVNRHNPAVGFYERHGFKKIYDEDIQIGNGYEMNDHVMQKLL